MIQYYKNIRDIIHENREDLEYLLFVGVPGGLVFIILSVLTTWDLSNLF